MADQKIWTVDIDETDRQKIKEMNTNIEDLVKKFGDGGVGKSSDAGKSDEKHEAGTPPSGGGGTTPAAPSPTPPTTAAPSPTPPTGSGGTGIPGAGDEIEGGFNGGDSFSVTGIKNAMTLFNGRWMDPTAFVAQGKAYPSDDEMKATRRWMDFEPMFRKLKKEIKKIQNDEISETEYNRKGQRLHMMRYVRGEKKFMKHKNVPERDTAEVNVIIALDHSGSVGGGYGSAVFDMSGATLALVKALEHQRIQFSLMIYESEVALVEVDKKGRSKRTNILAAATAGRGGNEEGNVVQVADKIAKQNRDKVNVFFVINDGGIDTGILPRVTAMRERTNAPLTTYCIGYGNGFSKENAEAGFGKGYVFETTEKNFASTIRTIVVDEVDKATRSDY